jgi:hypothetical protein
MEGSTPFVMSQVSHCSSLLDDVLTAFSPKETVVTERMDQQLPSGGASVL